MVSDYLIHYSQPDFYHFTRDSVDLADYAANLCHQHRREISHLLDLGAGCGVVGIEFYLRYKSVAHLMCIELQNFFSEHLKENLNQISDLKTDIFLGNWDQFSRPQQFDLILSNPPYYTTDSTRPSINPARDRCQRMARQELYTYLSFIRKHLSKEGMAIISLSRKGEMLKLALDWGKANGLKIHVEDFKDHLSFLRIMALNEERDK